MNTSFFWVGFGAIVLLNIGLLAFRYWSVAKLPTLREYRAMYRRKFEMDERAKCGSCGSTSIYIWWFLGPQMGFGPKKHICRGCGSDLWKS